MNAAPEISVNTEWVAPMAVLRGKLISLAVSHNKENQHHILSLTQELDQLYKNSMDLGLESLRLDVEQKCLELDTLFTAKVEEALKAQGQVSIT